MLRKYVEILKDQEINAKLLSEIIADHSTLRERTISNYGRYKQNDNCVPIFDREFHTDAANEINWKLANDWLGEIVDTKVGYMFGTPVIYQLEQQAARYDEVLERIEKFKKRNHMDDLNAEFGKFSALCGYDAAMLYIDEEGEAAICRVNPWEAIIITDGEITKPKYSIRYYETYDNRHRVHFFDELNEYIYEGQECNAESLAEVDVKPHDWGNPPLFGIPNNSELLGDADKVFSLIDSYDRTVSDHNNEIEQFRLAYMLFIGYNPSEEQLAEMRKNGAVYIPSVQEGEDIRYLTKSVDVASIDSHLKRLEKDITRFAKHVNFTDDSFGSNLSGVAMRYKLFALETKAKTMERKHEAAMLYMFKCLSNVWAIESVPLDFTMIDCKYTRNIAVDITAEANAAQALMGIVSQRTNLEQLSFINDVEGELDRIEEEKAGSVDLDRLTNNPIEEEDEKIEV